MRQYQDNTLFYIMQEVNNMFTEKFKVEIKGKSPGLMQHRYAGINSGPKRAGVIPDPAEEAERALYRTADGKIYEPALHIKTAMIKAATNFKIPVQGKKTFKDAFRAGVFVQPTEIPLDAQWVIDERPEVVSRARISRARPLFKEWSLEFEIEVIDERIGEQLLKTALSEAGMYHGIAERRPEYGRFDIVSFEKV